jgi:hypothetical protein
VVGAALEFEDRIVHLSAFQKGSSHRGALMA